MRTIIGIAFLLAACSARGADPQPAFEVASIRSVPDIGYPGSGVSRGGPGTADPGRLTYEHATLKHLVMNAYDIQQVFQVSGPAWIDSERFDIAAKLPEGTTKEQLNVMLQNLLAERFKLKFHRESLEFQVYELTVAKGGPKFKESLRAADATLRTREELDQTKITTDKDGLPQLPPGRPGSMLSSSMISARQQPISVLTRFLQSRMSFLGLPVVDNTGLTETYDFALKFALPGIGSAAPPAGDPATAASDPDPDVFTAVQQYLGLRLDKKKDPMDVLVIDQVQKPSEN